MVTSQYIAPTEGAQVFAPPIAANLPEKPLKSRYHTRFDGDWQEFWQPIMGPFGWAVFCHLKRRQGRNDHARPSHEEIASATGMSVSSVKRGLKRLAELGLCSWSNRTEETKHGFWRQTSNAYFLARCDLPCPSPQSDAPRSKRATKQEKQMEFIPKEQTAPRASVSPSAVVAPSSKDEIPSPLERELKALGINNATTRRRAADHPAEVLAALAQLRKKMRKGGLRDRGGYFVGTLDALVKTAASAPLPPSKLSSFVVEECSDAPAIEYAPSEADIAMEREARKESASPREFVEPLTEILARTAPKGVDSSKIPVFRLTPLPLPCEIVDEEQLAKDAACEAVYQSLEGEVLEDLRRRAIKAACGSSNHSRLKTERSKLVWREHRAAVAARMEATQ